MSDRIATPGLAERVGWLKDELRKLDEERWNPEHDLCEHCARQGCASSYDLHEVRKAVADLAAFVEKIAELCDMRAAESDRVARRQSAIENGLDPDV